MSGIIKQVMGPVIDVEFADGNLPFINNALKIRLIKKLKKQIKFDFVKLKEKCLEA